LSVRAVARAVARAVLAVLGIRLVWPGRVPRAAALRAGRSVAVFPEGTTFCGAARGRFRPAVFQAAVDAGAPVAPVSIAYGSTAPAFGDDSLWSSVRRA
jgi:1-acyl-sn-glycerol-3-phosphate acyltransferase